MPLIYEAPEGYLTQDQVAEMLHASKATIQRMAKDGRLAVHRDRRDARVKLFRREDVEALLGGPEPERKVE